MKRAGCFYLLIGLIGLACCDFSAPPEERKKSGRKLINNLLNRQFETEYLDSSDVDFFLQNHPSYQPYAVKIRKFYSRRNYQLAWSEDGEYVPQASMFLNMLRNAHNDGMSPHVFNIQEIENSMNISDSRHKDSLIRKKVDMELSGAYFKYSRKLWKGLVDPQEEGLDWFVSRKKIKYGKTLDSILVSDRDNPFEHFMPVHDEYLALKNELVKYHDIKKQETWPRLDSLRLVSLVSGDTSGQIFLLKKKLALTGDFPDNSIDSVYDSGLSDGIRRFQLRNGLAPTGKLTALTARKLCLPVDHTIRQILINMERWRWVPEKIGKNYLLVNIPEFRLRIIEEDKEMYSMKVIVGKSLSHTPVFNDKIEYVVFNPYWNIPENIALTELVPARRKDPESWRRQNIEIYQKYDFEHPVSAEDINWDSVDYNKFPYQLRQKPGKSNALGKYKFLFPNNFHVYLHDTPTSYLFDRETRSFSHGCIRIEEPEWLANYLLDNVSEEALKAALMKENQWFRIREKKQLPVYILYFTAWMDKDGRLQLRDDIYNHDQKLASLLFTN